MSNLKTSLEELQKIVDRLEELQNKPSDTFTAIGLAQNFVDTLPPPDIKDISQEVIAQINWLVNQNAIVTKHMFYTYCAAFCKAYREKYGDE
jgi:hypothetical protein